MNRFVHQNAVCISALAALLLAGTLALPAHSASILVSHPEEHPGGPFYSNAGISPETGVLNIPITDEWVAIPFERDIACIRPDFNLLDIFDIPAALFCTSMVTGQFLFNQPGPLIGINLKHSQVSGDAVPVVFAETGEFLAAIADDELFIGELLGLASAVVGTADFYTHTAVNGSLPPNQFMFKVRASGELEDGRAFRMHFNKSVAGQDAQIEVR